MKITLIGSGNVATHLGKAFYKAGHSIVDVFSRQKENALELANAVDARPLSELAELNADVDLYLICVKDDAIAEVVAALKKPLNAMVVHTAGSVSMEILKTASVDYGVFYPLQTFSKLKAVDFVQIPICVEAVNQELLTRLKSLALSISQKVVELESEQRKTLHLAAVFASNFANHMYAIADKLLGESDIPFDIIRPLIAETAQKAMETLPLQAQTGPAVRNDRKIIDEHIQLLKRHPDLQGIYKELSRHILGWAE